MMCSLPWSWSTRGFWFFAVSQTRPETQEEMDPGPVVLSWPWQMQHACCVSAPCSDLLEAGPPGSLAQVLLQPREPASCPFPFSEPNLGEDDEDKDLEPGPSGTSKASAQTSGQSDTDITAEFLQPLLTPDNVANLVRRDRGLDPSHWSSGSHSPSTLSVLGRGLSQVDSLVVMGSTES